MQLLQHFKALTVHPKNAQELKGLILQLAIQGKLTKQWREQNPDVESAAVLLKRIQEEKAQLVKEKKIKKENPLPKVTEDEIPYELHESWEWCRLNEVCEYIQRGKSPKYTEEPKIPVVSQKCVQWAGFDISRAKFITEESLEKYGIERFLQEGDLLWNSTGDGTIGRVISYPGSDYDKVVADSHVTVVRSFKQYVLPEYVWIFTASPLIQNLVAGRVSGSTKQTELGTGTVKLMEFSFPPLEEQKAIVATVNQLFKEVEALEEQTKARVQLKQDFVTSALQQLATGDTAKEWSFLQAHFKTFFTEKSAVKKLRETILQLAVQGKLTSSWRSENPGVEPAEVLLEKIKAEKAQLIKDKKIKVEKMIQPISEGEIPNSIPSGWMWCRMQDLCPNISSGSTPPKQFFKEEGIPYLKVYNIKNQKIDFEYREQFVDLEYHSTKLKRSILKPGDVIMNIVGPPLGKVAIIPDDFPEWNCNQAISFFQPLNRKLNTWIYTYLLAGTFLNHIELIGTAGQDNISVTKSKTIPIPLPPFEEQKAIVEKVNALMSLCDGLEKEIEHSTMQVEQLMQSCLKEVFEPSVTAYHNHDQPPLLMAAEEGGEYEPESVLLERIKK